MSKLLCLSYQWLNLHKKACEGLANQEEMNTLQDIEQGVDILGTKTKKEAFHEISQALELWVFNVPQPPRETEIKGILERVAKLIRD